MAHLNNDSSYLVQYHNAGARNDSVPGHCYSRNETFMNKHWGGGELRGVSTFGLSRKGRRKLLFLLWMDWTTQRKIPFTSSWPLLPSGIPQPLLPEDHKITKWQDNWQPRLQARTGYASDGLVLSNPESVALFANKFIVKSKLVGDDLQHFEVLEFKGKKEQKKRRRKVGRKDKSYEDYPWTELGEDETKLKKSYVFQN